MMRHQRAALTTAIVTTLAIIGLSGCTSGSTPQSAPPQAPTVSATPTPTPTPTPPPRARPAPVPDKGACYRLSYDEAVAPTAAADPVACKRRHNAETYAVGTVDNLVDGHLLAIDSRRVQEAVAQTCPAALGKAVGGTEDDLRLSMVRAVWFTPTVAESDDGASWYRCDLVTLAGTEQLAGVKGSLLGVLDTPEGRDTYGMCGTAGPDDPAFERVPCRDTHSWKAFSVIDLPGTTYPGRAAITQAGEQPCNDAAAGLAADPLDYQWGFEGPDQQQWNAGQTFIRCWTPG